MTLQVGDILKVVAIAAWLDGNLNMNVFNATIAGSGGPYDEEDVVADALEWVESIYDEMLNLCSDELDGSQVKVYEYDAVDEDWDEVGTTPWVWDPAGSSDQLPRGVAHLVNAKSSNPDVNGKKYFGGSVEGNSTDGLWIGSATTIIIAAAAAWVDPFTGSTSGADFQPVIWSPTKTTPYFLTGDVIIPTIPAYQRRRKRGIGV